MTANVRLMVDDETVFVCGANSYGELIVQMNASAPQINQRLQVQDTAVTWHMVTKILLARPGLSTVIAKTRATNLWKMLCETGATRQTQVPLAVRCGQCEELLSTRCAAINDPNFHLTIPAFASASVSASSMSQHRRAVFAENGAGPRMQQDFDYVLEHLPKN